MIRAVCPEAVAELATGFVTGWNVTPNVAYTLSVHPGASSGVVLLLSADGGTLLASGVFLTGTNQPVTLVPQSGQTIDRVDEDLSYHLLITTTGAEAAQTFTIGPFVDGMDQIAAMYATDELAIAQATAVIREGTHSTDDAVMLCPRGCAQWLGEVVAATVHGDAVTGDIEAVAFDAGPQNMADVITIRSMSAMLPSAAPTPPIPPTVSDDAGETDASTAISGNALANDQSGLTVTAVNGLSANVGQTVSGSNGGEFVINADGAWTFDPNGDFSSLAESETADTSVTYHASNGQEEASATLTATVRAIPASVPTDDRWEDVVFCINASGEDGSTMIADAKGLTVSRYGDTQIDTSLGYPAVQFDGTGDYMTLQNSAATKLESGVFTFDAWIYFDGLGERRGIIGNRQLNNLCGIVFHTQADNTLRVFMTGGGLISTATAHPVTTGLHHVELSIDASRMCRIFIDGVLRGSGALAAGAESSAALQIGREQDGASTEMAKDRRPAMRLTRGSTVRHTADFAPPDFPFPTA